MQELVEGKISIIYIVTSKGQLGELDTKYLSKDRHCNVIKLINEFEALNAKSSSSPRGGHHFPALRILACC